MGRGKRYIFRSVTKKPHTFHSVWAPVPAWTFSRREKCLAHVEIWAPDFPARRPVTVVTALSWSSTDTNTLCGQSALSVVNP
jgi:hypothetical protein